MAIVAAIAAGLPAVTSGAVINVDFNNGNDATTTFNGAAADPSGSGSWNGITISSGTSVNLLDSTGAATGVSMIVTGGSRNWSSSTGTTANPLLLMEDYRVLDTNATGGSLISVALSGVPDGQYKLYVYAAGDTAGQGANIAIDPSNVLAAGVSSGATTGNTRDITDAGNPGTNYIILDALVNDPGAAGWGTISFTASNLAGKRFGGLNAFQLQPVQSAAAPEPASLGLLSAGALALIRRRRSGR